MCSISSFHAWWGRNYPRVNRVFTPGYVRPVNFGWSEFAAIVVVVAAIRRKLLVENFTHKLNKSYDCVCFTRALKRGVKIFYGFFQHFSSVCCVLRSLIDVHSVGSTNKNEQTKQDCLVFKQPTQKKEILYIRYSALILKLHTFYQK